MAFWGIEVKPGKPFTHSFDRVRGRLRISQATLAIGSSTKKSLVQCNIGDKSPVLLCALLPDKTESCHLDLEFEEADEVVFSVIGPRSVFLTGYYVSNGRHSNINDDTDSYGEDIANTETEGSDRCSDDDEYEDSFINDDDTEVFPLSPVSNGGVVEETINIEKPKDRKGSLKRLKKKYQSVESDDDTTSWQLNIFNSSRSVPESEGEDKFPISSLYKNKTTTKDMKMEAAEEEADKGTVDSRNNMADDTHAKTDDDDTCRIELKGKADALIMDNEPKRGSDLPTTEVGPENGVKPKKKRKERSREGETLEADCGNHINALKVGKTHQAEAEANNLDQDLLVRNKLDLKPINNMGNDLSHISLLPSMELGSENGVKVKKRRKERVAEDQAKQDEVKADSMGRDLPVRNESDQKPASDMRFDIDPDRLADGCQSGEKKIKKKKKKKSETVEEKENVDIDTPFLPKDENNRYIIGLEDKNVDAMSSQVRILSNGLIIEELKRGKSEGKIAAPGRKVKVQFIVKLKENGQIIDSNIGKAPYKFRLGDGEVIEGWNVGLDGMRVGDQRRLIVPPSMGYGSQETGENIPPNSWLVYEVELVGVR